MKKAVSLFLILVLLTGAAPCQSVLGAEKNTMVQIWVAPNGNDATEISSESAPFRTIQRAQQAVRGLKKAGLTQNVEVILRGGVYELAEPIRFTSEDGGSDAFRVTYMGYPGECPMISGGRKITNFEPAENGMWKTVVNELETIRELTVNNTRVYRAAIEDEVYPLEFYDDPTTAYPRDGYYFDKRVLPLVEQNGDVELRWGISWRCHTQILSDIIQDPTDDSRVIALGTQPQFMQNIHQNDEAVFFLCRPGAPCRIENALEFLNRPGEYYFNKKTKELYYMPREGEDMRTAEVYASVLDRVLYIQGADGALVNNLRFENIRFGHTTFLAPEKFGGYSNQQANECMVTDSIENSEDPAAVEVNHAQNIRFEKCTFFATGATGVRMRHTVRDSQINGCVFYDTGGSGIVVGSNSHGSNPADDEPSKPDRVDMWYHSKWEVSDLGIYGEAPIYTNVGNNGVHPMNDVNRGIKSWFKLKFDQPVSIDEIYYGYYTGTEADEEIKHNFEIIAATKEDFSDGVQLYEQGDNPAYGWGVTIKPKDTTTKFQYLLIRATKVQEFGMRFLNIWTKDYDWQMNDVPRRIEITNNYLTRLGNYLYGAPGITAYYYHGLTIAHNEIYKTSYSAISSGWGWSLSENQPLTDLKINYNRISDFLTETIDGGGIYTLSKHRGAEIRGNYIKNANGNYAAIYNDNGSSGFVIDKNVCENASNSLFFHSGDIQGNIATNLYATSDFYRNVGDNSVAPIQTFISGNPTPTIREIMDQSGLTQAYRGIKNTVPDNETYYGKTYANKYNSFLDLKTDTETITNDYLIALQKNAETALSRAVCGDLPGQYSGQMKLMLQERLAESKEKDKMTGKEMLEQIIRLKNALDDFTGSLVQCESPKAQSLVAAAERLAEENPDADASALQAVIAEGKQMADNDYTMMKKLEAYMHMFDRALRKTDILGLRVQGSDALPVIERETKTVTIGVDAGRDLSAVKISAAVPSNAVVFPDLSKPVDLTYPLQLVIKNGDHLAVWYVTAEVVNDGDKSRTALWRNRLDGKVTEYADGVLLLEKSASPYMFTGEKSNTVEVAFTPQESDDFYGSRIVFLCEDSEPRYAGTSDSDSCFELAVKKNTLELYRIENGVRSVIYGSDYDSEKNMTDTIGIAGASNYRIRIETHVVGERVVVQVFLNGELKINALCDVNRALTSGYFGLFSEYSDILLEV